MRFLRSLVSSLSSRTATRRFAQVHDVRIELTSTSTSQEEAQEAKAEPNMERNVLGRPLQLHSTSPLTGFLRNAYCSVPSADRANHSVAAVVSDEFLDFSASRGNDLRQVGLTGGCKWCLCVSRWKEAFDARTGDKDPKVPKVYLQRTNERALEGVKLEELRRFAVDEGSGVNGSS